MLKIMKTIFIMSINGSILVMLILLIKAILKDKLNTKFHYFIWFLLIIKLIMPYEFKSDLSIFNVSDTLIEKQKIISVSSGTVDKNYVAEKSINNDKNIGSFNNKMNYERVLLYIWLLGILCSMSFLVHGIRKFKVIKKLAYNAYILNFNEILNNCLKTMNIKKEISLMYTDHISSPCLYGIFHPIIFIPKKATKTISENEFKYIVMHELCHLKRKDIIINWITIILNIVYWFNPIIRYGLHKMKQDCEISCDSDAIKYLSNDENIDYGNTIIKILQIDNKQNTLIGTTSMIINKSGIKRRILMISKYKKISLKSILVGILVIAIIGTVGLTKASNFKKEDKLNEVSQNKTDYETHTAAGFDKNTWNTSFELWDGTDLYKTSENEVTYNITVSSTIKSGTVNIKVYNDEKVLFEKYNPVSETIKISKEDAKNVKIETIGSMARGSYRIHVDNGQEIQQVNVEKFKI